MKSHKVYTTSSRRGWKEPQQGLCWWLDLGCGKGEMQLWTPQWTICDVMVLGRKGVLENRPESPHQDTEAVYMHHESQGCSCLYPTSLVLFMGSYSFLAEEKTVDES